MKKYLILFFIVLFCSGFSFSDLADPVYQNIKQQAISSFSDLFSGKVEIGSAGGIIVGQINLYDVKIGKELKAQRVVIYFNPVNYLAAGGDVVPAITGINVYGGRAQIIRDKKGGINAVHFLAPPKPGGPAFPFKAKINLFDCRAEYRDDGGLPFRPRAKPFSADFEKISGSIDLKKPPKITLDLAAYSGLGSLFAIGNVNPGKNIIDLKIAAKELDIKKWSPYLLPYFDFESGTANLVLDIKNEQITMQGNGTADGIKFEVNGKIFDKLDLKVALENADLSKAKKFFKEIKGIDLKGIADVNLNILGPYQNLRLSADAKAAAYGGKLSLSGAVNLSSKNPTFKISGELDGLDLKEFTLNSPAVSGKISGRAEASGTINDFSGRFESSFKSSSVLGQPLESGRLNFKFKNNRLTIDSLNLKSATADFNGSGVIESDLSAALSASATGILLKGTGFLGDMQARVDNFNGNLSFKLNEEFLKSPIKKLTASGTVEMSEIKLGEQSIDKASGGIELFNGKIKIIEANIKSGDSTINVSGEVGMGEPTELKIYSSLLNLSDLKILNNLLPPELKDPTGAAAVDFRIFGTLQKIASFDDLMNLEAVGEIRVTGANLGGLLIREASLEAAWQSRNLSLKNLYFKSANSELSGYYSRSKTLLDAKLTAKFDLSDFSPALKRIGFITGSGKIDVNLKGDPAKPQGQASLDIKNLRYNQIGIDSLNGALAIKDHELSFSRPIEILSGGNRFKISGGARLADDFQESEWAANIELQKGDITSLFDLLQKIYIESAKFVAPAASGLVKIDAGSLAIKSPPFRRIFYLNGGRQDYYLKFFEKISSEVSAYEKKQEIPSLEKITGQVSGKINFTGTIKKPNFDLTAELKNASYGKYPFESLSMNAQYLGGDILIKSISLSNKGGRADLGGSAGLDGRLNLRAAAWYLPIDFLKIFTDRKFEGLLSGSALIGGTVKSPTFSLSFKGIRGNLAGVSFDELSGQAAYNGKTASLTDIKMIEGKEISEVQGSFDLSGGGEISATIEGEAAGLVGLLTDEIQWRSGKSSGNLNLLLKQGRPQLNGNLKLKDAVVYVKRLDSDITSGDLELLAEGTGIKIDKLAGIWYGKTSRGQANYISLAGALDLATLDMNWALADSHFNIDFPDLYKGEIDLKGITLSGVPGKMLLKGRIDFNDGILYLPKNGAGAAGVRGAAGPLNFDLGVNLNKNVYLAAGDVLTLDLSNIFLNLEMAGQDIKVLGNVLEPRLLGKVIFKRGTVNILNREFSLLSEDMQKKFYPYDLERVTENYAQFEGDGVMPYLHLSALVKVEAEANKEVSIVSNLIGTLQAREESKKLNVTFDAFEEDKTKTPPEMVRSRYSDQDIRVMLLPDFIKSLAGVDTKAVVADYLNSRLQSVVFRNLERGVEKALGLESLTLEYNFGSDIKRALGVEDTGRTEKPTFGVGFVKGFFDKLYIDVRYSQGIEQQAGVQQQSINYQIIYKLSPVWSVAYYREPANIYDLNSGYYKTTLKAGYSF